MTEYRYDGAGRVTGTIGAVGVLDVITSTHYDGFGRRDFEIDAMQNRTDYKYDASGRLTAVILPAVLDSEPGSPTEGEMVQPRYEYDYDAYGNQEVIRDPMDDDLAGTEDKETHFTYDHFGRQVTRTLPDGLVETMGYNDTPLVDLTNLQSSVGLGQLEYTEDFEGRVTVYRYDNTPAGAGGWWAGTTSTRSPTTTARSPWPSSRSPTPTTPWAASWRSTIPSSPTPPRRRTTPRAA